MHRRERRPDDALVPVSRDWRPEDSQELVLNYLVYNCNQHTAAAFVREWLGDSPEAQQTVSASAEWKSLEYRSRLCELIRNGQIVEAIEYIEEFFPYILQSHDGLENPLKFTMHCQVFVEMIKRGDTATALVYADNVLAPVSEQHPDYSQQLQTVGALLAYADPSKATTQSLLGQTRREDLAMQVNAAILKAPRPSLYEVARLAVMEMIWREAGVEGPRRTERRFSEALAGRTLSDILGIP